MWPNQICVCFRLPSRTHQQIQANKPIIFHRTSAAVLLRTRSYELRGAAAEAVGATETVKLNFRCTVPRLFVGGNIL